MSHHSKYKITMTDQSPVHGVLRIHGGPTLKFEGVGSSHTVELDQDTARHIYGFDVEEASTQPKHKSGPTKGTKTADKEAS